MRWWQGEKSEIARWVSSHLLGLSPFFLFDCSSRKLVSRDLWATSQDSGDEEERVCLLLKSYLIWDFPSNKYGTHRWLPIRCTGHLPLCPLHHGHYELPFHQVTCWLVLMLHSEFFVARLSWCDIQTVSCFLTLTCHITGMTSWKRKFSALAPREGHIKNWRLLGGVVLWFAFCSGPFLLNSSCVVRAGAGGRWARDAWQVPILRLW